MDNYAARKFSEESYKNSDGLAKQLFTDFIKRHGHTVIKDKEDFSYDIIAEKQGVQHRFELEIKRRYPFTDNKSFRFDTVSFLGRKKRLHDLGEFYYIIICYETGWALSCKSSDIYNERYIQNLYISTSHREGRDQMYRVPKHHCTFFNLSEYYG
jgi:hypothetical protein